MTGCSNNHSESQFGDLVRKLDKANPIIVPKAIVDGDQLTPNFSTASLRPTLRSCGFLIIAATASAV